jgi:hypothetical protein
MSNDVILVPPLEGGRGIYCLYEREGKPVGSVVCGNVTEAVKALGPRALRDYDDIVHVDLSGISRDRLMELNKEWARGLGGR